VEKGKSEADLRDPRGGETIKGVGANGLLAESGQKG
jgi:hypothetical protein